MSCRAVASFFALGNADAEEQCQSRSRADRRRYRLRSGRHPPFRGRRRRHDLRGVYQAFNGPQQLARINGLAHVIVALDDLAARQDPAAVAVIPSQAQLELVGIRAMPQMRVGDGGDARQIFRMREALTQPPHQCFGIPIERSPSADSGAGGGTRKRRRGMFKRVGRRPPAGACANGAPWPPRWHWPLPLRRAGPRAHPRHPAAPTSR